MWLGAAGPTGRASEGIEIAKLGAVGAVRNFVRDREIYREGDAAEFFFKVASGLVRTCKFLSDGRRQIDAFYGPDDVFGLEPSAEHCLQAEAACDSAVVSYRRRDLDLLAANSEAVSRQLWLHAMRGLTRAQEHSITLGRRRALEKMAAFLIERAAQAVEPNEIFLLMTRRDIADYLGMTLETVSRTLTELRERNLISLISARQITLMDAPRLHALNY